MKPPSDDFVYRHKCLLPKQRQLINNACSVKNESLKPYPYQVTTDNTAGFYSPVHELISPEIRTAVDDSICKAVHESLTAYIKAKGLLIQGAKYIDTGYIFEEWLQSSHTNIIPGASQPAGYPLLKILLVLRASPGVKLSMKHKAYSLQSGFCLLFPDCWTYKYLIDFSSVKNKSGARLHLISTNVFSL